MRQKKVSIIISAYNTVDYIEKCLQSCTCQTLDDIEIIVVNNGSTDGTGALLSQFKQNSESDIKVFDFEKNTGDPAEPWNFAIKKSEAKYIMIVDSDDWIEPETCEILYSLAEKEACDMAIANHYEELSDDVTIPVKAVDSECSRKRYMLNPHMAPWGKVIRRDFFYENNLWFKSQIHCDTGFNLIAYSRCKKICFSDDYLYHYNRMNENSETNTKKRFRQAKIVETLQYVLDNYNKEWEQETIFVVFNFLYWFCYMEYIYHVDIFIPFAQKYRKQIERNRYIKNNRNNTKVILDILNQKMVPKTIVCPRYKEELKEYEQFCVQSWERYAPDYEIIYLDRVVCNKDRPICNRERETKLDNYRKAMQYLEDHGGVLMFPDILLDAPIGEFRIADYLFVMEDAKKVSSHIVSSVQNSDIITIINKWLMDVRVGEEINYEQSVEEMIGKKMFEVYEQYVANSKAIENNKVKVIAPDRCIYGFAHNAISAQITESTFAAYRDGMYAYDKKAMAYIRKHEIGIYNSYKNLESNYNNVVYSKTWIYGNILKKLYLKIFGR